MCCGGYETKFGAGEKSRRNVLLDLTLAEIRHLFSGNGLLVCLTAICDSNLWLTKEIMGRFEKPRFMKQISKRGSKYQYLLSSSK